MIQFSSSSQPMVTYSSQKRINIIIFSIFVIPALNSSCLSWASFFLCKSSTLQPSSSASCQMISWDLPFRKILSGCFYGSSKSYPAVAVSSRLMSTFGTSSPTTSTILLNGATYNDVPITIRRSVSQDTFYYTSKKFTGSDSPKNTISGFTGPPHSTTLHLMTSPLDILSTSYSLS